MCVYEFITIQNETVTYVSTSKFNTAKMFLVYITAHLILPLQEALKIRVDATERFRNDSISD